LALWTQPSQRVFRFDAFEVDLWTGELRKNGAKLKVQEQPMKVLAMLLARSGELVTREQLRAGLWSDDTFVDFDRGLNTAVNRLRAALRDCAESPRFIETVGSRGYRFIGLVTPDASSERETGTQSSLSSGRVYEWPKDDPGQMSGASTTPEMPVALDRTLIPPQRWSLVALAVAILVVAGTIVYGVIEWGTRGLPPSLESIQITKLTDTGKAEAAAISPDGRFVAYLFRDGQDTSLRLRQVGASGEAQVLVHEPLLFPGISFSPDGNHLYFLRATSKDTLFRDLFEIPTLGGPERKVTSNIDTAISFSPDGQQFVYERGMPDSVEIRIAKTDGSGDRLMVNLQGGSADSLPGAAWSPDGASIAVPVWMTHEKPGFVLDVISTAKGEIRKLYSGYRLIGRPRWLPDGSSLIVPINSQSGRTQLWTVSYPAGESRRLTNDLADYDWGIDTTLDGKMLATVQRTSISNLWVSPAADAASGKQITFGEQHISNIFSLDGKPAIVNSANNELWLMNADGSHHTLPVDAYDATLADCGHFIVFVSFRSGTSELMRMDRDAAHVMRLATGTTWTPVCSLSGRFVYYLEVLEPRWKIRRVSIEGGPPVDVEESPGTQIPGRIAISPNGQLLAFPYDGGSPEPAIKIGVIPVAGGPLLKKFEVETDIHGEIDTLRWSPDGRSLQYPVDKDGATNLWEQPVAGGPPHQLTKFKSGKIFDFNWSADGKQLLLSRGEVTSDVVLLRNLR
jgi:eukaryotic-like serine/threonine-protein kinase